MFRYISSKITNREEFIDILIIIFSFIFAFLLGPFTWSFISFVITAAIFELFLFLITGGLSPDWKCSVRIIANLSAFVGFCISRYIFLGHIGVEHYF